MADFSDGVKEYIEAEGKIINFFPVDWKGNKDISCFQCDFFSRNSGACLITKEVTPYPQKFVGRICPFDESIKKNNIDEGENNG